MFGIHLKNQLTRIPNSANALTAYLLRQMRIIETYQPIDKQSGKRACYDRWERIGNYVSCEKLCLDVGCNTGFFAHKVAEKGIFTIGFDSEIKNVIVANATYSRNNLLFKHLALNAETASQLPPADSIIFLSVFHHLVKNYGQDAACLALKNLANRCRRHFFFETGQPDERGTKFCGLMAFIGDVETWTRSFFVDRCGFSAVKCLGEFETFLTPTPRKLFVAIR